MRRTPPGRHRPKVRAAVRRMTYLGRSRGPGPASADGSDHEDRAVPEALRRRPEPQDQLADGSRTARIILVQQLRLSLEGTTGHLDMDVRVGKQIGRPGAVDGSRGDQ